MEPLTDARSRNAQWEALYAKHSARVMRLARLLLDDLQEARDVAQEVFVKLLRRAQAPDPPSEWGGWLTRVTVNTCRDRRRAGWWRWWRRHESAEELGLEAPEPTPERVALSREEQERIWRAFRRLPRRQREVFALRHVEGWSTEAVAAALGLHTGSVKRHLFRAVGSLRKELGGRP